MSVTVVFSVSFLLLLVITLGVPYLPPGDLLFDLLHNFLGIPEITFNVLAFSGEALVNGIINGVLWGIFISIIYLMGRRTSKKEVIVMPLRPATPTPAPKPAPIVILKSAATPTPAPKPAPVVILKPQKISSPYKVRKIKTYVPLDKDIETIEGIGHIYGSKLRFIGVKVVGDLLRVASTWKGRRNLAEKVGVTPSLMFKWVNKADFLRIRGVGKQYADLLDSAGVNTVIDLSRRNPKDLYDKLRKTNMEKNLVRRTPPYRRVEDWIQNTKRLQSIVEY